MNKSTYLAAGVFTMSGLTPVNADGSDHTAHSTMTNIVTMVDSCDIAAIGVDFGLTTGVFQSDISSVTANTAVGSILNSNHPQAAADGGAGNDDELHLVGLGNSGSAAGAPATTALKTTLAKLISGQPGVFIACTAEPSSLTVSGFYGDIALSTQVSATSTAALKSTMQRMSSNGTVDHIDYQLSFSQSIVQPAPQEAALFTGAYHATGLISASANSRPVSAGFYADTTLATLTF